jgi:hypothetical protein
VCVRARACMCVSVMAHVVRVRVFSCAQVHACARLCVCVRGEQILSFQHLLSSSFL